MSNYFFSSPYRSKPQPLAIRSLAYESQTCNADDIALLESMNNCLNESKTESMSKMFSGQDNQSIRTLKNFILKQVDDYKYLGSFISSSQKDFEVHKGLIWAACNTEHIRVF